MRIHIVTKSKNELQIECEEFSMSKNTLTGMIDGYEIKGITDNKPLYIDFNNIDFIYREVSE